MSNSRWIAGFSCLAAVLLLSLPSVVRATPSQGGNCKACHGTSDASKAQVQAWKSASKMGPDRRGIWTHLELS